MNLNELYSTSLESQQIISIFWNKFRTFRVAYACNRYKKRLHGNFPIKDKLESTKQLNLTQKEPITGVTSGRPLSDSCLRCIKATL